MKKQLLSCFIFLGLSTSVIAQSWHAGSSSTLYGINSTLSVTPLDIGIGTSSPTAQLHTTDDVRFEGLINDNTAPRIIGSDASGNLSWLNVNTFLSNAWLTTGNFSTNPLTNYVGTNDAAPLAFRTNNVEQMRINVTDPITGIGVVQVGQSSTNNGNLSVWGQDIVGYSYPFNIGCNITGASFSQAQSSLPAVNTLGRMMRFTQTNGSAQVFYDAGIDRDQDFFITNRINIGGGLPTRSIVVSSNNVGINFPMLTGTAPAMTPTANFHTRGTVRHEGLPSSTTGTILVTDANGYVFSSNVSVGSGLVQNACATTDMIPKTIDASGNLDCSQIYDDGTTVGINKTSGFAYTGGGALTGGTPGPQTVKLDVSGLIRSTTLVVTSDKKYKTDIERMGSSLEKIMELNPVEYYWDSKRYPEKGFDYIKHSGFIAQELEKVLPNTVIIDDKGDYAVDYISMIPVLTKGMQEQQAIIESQNSKIQSLEERLRILEANSTGITDKTKTVAELFQNNPNPFRGYTTISYRLPESFTKASMAIYDLNGRLLKTYELDTRSEGEVHVDATELAAGMYLYSLVVDGAEVATKRMILSE